MAEYPELEAGRTLVLGAGQVINAPSSLIATPVSASRIDLTWTDNSDNETGFRIERAKDAGFTVELAVFTVGANVTVFSNTGLAGGVTYYYRVFATGAGGSISPASNTANALTPLGPPAAPTSLMVQSVGATSITLAWKDNASNETGFYVERRPGAGAWTRVATLSANVTQHTNTGLARRTAYSYRVQAYNAGGVSAYSNVVTGRTL